MEEKLYDREVLCFLEGRREEVHIKENETNVQSEKSPAQESCDEGVGCLMAEL